MAFAYSEIPGGITAPKGFRAAAGWCGIKPSGDKRSDLGVILSDVPAVAAATFTTNRIKAAPVRVSTTHLRSADARGLVVNSGNANACTGAMGIRNAKRMAQAVAKSCNCRDRQIFVCSTGRIGPQLPIEKIEFAIPELVGSATETGGAEFADSILTTDTFRKEIAIELELGRGKVRLGGVAKGAGMIDPEMATMLCFVTTDATLAKRDLRKMFLASIQQSFNCITIDGDMSTNDTAICLANGEAHLPAVEHEDADAVTFAEGLNYVTRNLARMIVEDGEGVTKFVEVHVKGAATYQDARRAAEAIANSNLVKCSWYGEDPNWGRIMDAVGYSAAKVREEMIDIFFNGIIAVEHGMASLTPAEKVGAVLQNKKFTVTIDLHLGTAEYKVFTTDLTPEYVKLNMGE